MKNFVRIAILVCGGAALLSADTVSINGSLSASATFTYNITSQTVSVTLTNLTPTIGAANLLTDFIFQLSDTSGLAPQITSPSGDISATAGQLVNVSSTGSVSAATDPAAWGFGIYNDSTLTQYNGSYLICTVCGAGVTAPYQPSEGILGHGTGSGSTPYSTANGSIKANDPHNPFFGTLTGGDGSATFQFSAKNLSANTFVTNAYFSFGTAWGTEIPGGTTITGGELPEPVTFVLTGTALLGVGLFSRRRAKRSQQ
ncbi:MAG: hypothetical protein KGN36_15580 [Acidobacteriota bacterium]|nr:hypothetical protein [Acidobacteriota bacterium]